MSGTLTTIRAGIATALTNAFGSEDQQISAYVLRNPEFPTLWVRPKPDTPIEYHGAMANGLETWHLQVEGFVRGDIQAQMQLDAWLESSGSNSVKAALEADTTLGGVVQNIVVQFVVVYSEFVDAAGNPAFGAAWTVQVYP